MPGSIMCGDAMQESPVLGRLGRHAGDIADPAGLSVIRHRSRSQVKDRDLRLVALQAGTEGFNAIEDQRLVRGIEDFFREIIQERGMNTMSPAIGRGKQVVQVF